MKKPVHLESRKPEREAWAKKGYLGGLKTRKAVQAKFRDLKRINMSRWITLQPVFSTNYQTQAVLMNLISFGQAAKGMRRLNT